MIGLVAALLATRIFSFDGSGALTNEELFSAVGPWLDQIGNCQIAFCAANKAAVYEGRKFDPSFFPFGSVTKSATAALVLRLAELKKLSLSDRLSIYGFHLPGDDTVSLEQLLTHTSGYPEYFWGADPAVTPSENMVWDLVRKAVTTSAPTPAPFKYSNTNYFILGVICEQVTGKKLDELYQQYLFSPLGLGIKPGRTEKFDPHWYGGAGELMGTAEDLANWSAAIARVDSRVLKPSSWERMLAGQVPMNERSGSGDLYGFGVILSSLSIYDSASHAGELPQNGLEPPFVSLMIARRDRHNPSGFSLLTRAKWSKSSLNAAYGAFASATAMSDAKTWISRLRRSPAPEQFLRWVSDGEMSPDLAKEFGGADLGPLDSAIGRVDSLSVEAEQVSGSSVMIALRGRGAREKIAISARFGPHGRLEGFGFKPASGGLK
jgi:Beta-lactamase